jgi:hypothetical protein
MNTTPQEENLFIFGWVAGGFFFFTIELPHLYFALKYWVVCEKVRSLHDQIQLDTSFNKKVSSFYLLALFLCFASGIFVIVIQTKLPYKENDFFWFLADVSVNSPCFFGFALMCRSLYLMYGVTENEYQITFKSIFVFMLMQLCMIIGGLILGQVRYNNLKTDMVMETIGFGFIQLGTYALTYMLIQVANK